MVNHARTSSIEEERKVALREQVIQILYRQFGNRDDIYECADEWCRKQVTTAGLVSYFNAYYGKRLIDEGQKSSKTYNKKGKETS